MIKTYRFDPDLIATELDAIHEWCRTNGLDPAIIPTNALVVIADDLLTVDEFVRDANGSRVFDEEANDAARTTRTVPLVLKPDLASLKPIAEPTPGGTT